MYRKLGNVVVDDKSPIYLKMTLIIPHWANFVTMDQNGDWRAWEDEPELTEGKYIDLACGRNEFITPSEPCNILAISDPPGQFIDLRGVKEWRK